MWFVKIPPFMPVNRYTFYGYFCLITSNGLLFHPLKQLLFCNIANTLLSIVCVIPDCTGLQDSKQY